jgi:arabinose-5-phosphate isomerase
LLIKKGFTPEQFKVLHPGGVIGQNLTFASEIMHTGSKMPIVHENLSMNETVIIMSSGRLGCVGVIDSNSKIVGIITDGDLRRHMSNLFFSQKASEIMTANPTCIGPRTFLTEVLAIMETNKITCVFVTDGQNIPLGCIHIHDILGRNIMYA